MATNRKRVSRRRDAEIDPELLAWFRDSGPRPALFHFMKDGELQAAWDTCSADIVTEWAESAPGTRPPFWWQFDAPEPRRRLGGMGTPASDVMAYAPRFVLGISADWVDDEAIERGVKADRFDPADPPAYESQTAYLKRVKMLLSGEARRLLADAFEPEVLPGERWPV
jgi:hypothetical protein